MNHNLFLNKKVINKNNDEMFLITHIDDVGIFSVFSQSYLRTGRLPIVSKITPLIVLFNNDKTIIEKLDKSFYDDYYFMEEEELIGELNIPFNRREYSYLVDLLCKKITDNNSNLKEIDFFGRILSEINVKKMWVDIE
jgi:hypothetical protein